MVNKSGKQKGLKAVWWQRKVGSLQDALHRPLGHSTAWGRTYLRSLSPRLSICDIKGLTHVFHVFMIPLRPQRHLPGFHLFGLFLNGVQLIYNVVLLSAVKQSNRVKQIYTYPLCFRFFFHVDHYRVLNRVPCAIQQVLIDYLLNIQQHVSVNSSLLIYPSSSLFPLVTISLQN